MHLALIDVTARPVVRIQLVTDIARTPVRAKEIEAQVVAVVGSGPALVNVKTEVTGSLLEARMALTFERSAHIYAVTVATGRRIVGTLVNVDTVTVNVELVPVTADLESAPVTAHCVDALVRWRARAPLALVNV
jgi:hypothetical protein